MATKKVAKQVLKDSRLIDSKGETDTIKLWESYREQATLWRAIALLQIPATLVIVIFCVVLWQTRDITLNVPMKPLPGLYVVKEIPDTEFIDVTTNYLNLIATYQPVVARRQFLKAMEMTKEPMLTQFKEEMMNRELKAIENTNRTQIFFINPTETKIRYENNQVIVTMTGERVKYIAGKELPSITTEFEVTMTTIPRNSLNPYGIVISNVNYKNLDEIE